MTIPKSSNVQAAAIGAASGLAMFAALSLIYQAPASKLEVTKSPVIAEIANVAVGKKISDGTIYAGTSPDTGKPIFATPTDSPLTYNFAQAQSYCANLDAHGYKDWHVPTKSELNVLFQNRAAIGGFDTTGSGPAGWYWSSSQDNIYDAWAQRFSDGLRNFTYRRGQSSLRCVRG